MEDQEYMPTWRQNTRRLLHAYPTMRRPRRDPSSTFRRGSPNCQKGRRGWGCPLQVRPVRRLAMTRGRTSTTFRLSCTTQSEEQTQIAPVRPEREAPTWRELNRFMSWNAPFALCCDRLSHVVSRFTSYPAARVTSKRIFLRTKKRASLF